MIRSVFTWILALPKLYSIGGAAVIVLAVSTGAHFLSSSPESPADTTAGISHVRVMTVGDLSSAVGPLALTGKITSLSQANILAQSSGEIVSLPRAIGDRVGAGAVIATFENASQQAAVQQAQGAYDAAVAAYNRARGSTADNSQTAAVNALQGAYSSLDDAIHTRADQLFTNPRSSSPILSITVPNSSLVNMLQSSRVSLEATLTNARVLSSTALPENAIERSEEMLLVVQEVRTFLDNLIQAVNETLPSSSVSASTLSGYQTSLATARTQTLAAASSLTSAKSTVESNDLKAIQANVTSALGALNAAKANLEKTIVRSPINGTIVSLSVTRGDFVSTFSQVATVSNPSALYVETQVTPADAKTLLVGGKVSIAGSTTGIITFIAPALDPSTGKIEVKIGITGSQTALTDGEVVSVSLDRAQGAAASKNKVAILTIPIIAAKITPAGPVVFSVDSSHSTLVAHPITLGSILGNQITIASGLSADMQVVTDARGLAAGQTVIVDAP